MTLFKELKSLSWVEDPDGERVHAKKMEGKCQDKEGNVWFVCNGRPIEDRGPRAHEHIYICAKNKADACRLMEEWRIKLSPTLNIDPYPQRWITEINVYFNKGAWGNRLDNTVVERGLWVQWKHTDTSVTKEI